MTFYENVHMLKAHLAHRDAVEKFVAELITLKEKADNFITDPDAKPDQAAAEKSVKLLALYESNTMEKFGQIYDEKDLKKLVKALQEAYGDAMVDKDLEAHLLQVDRNGKLACLSADNAKREALHEEAVENEMKKLAEKS